MKICIFVYLQPCLDSDFDIRSVSVHLRRNKISSGRYRSLQDIQIQCGTQKTISIPKSVVEKGSKKRAWKRLK